MLNRSNSHYQDAICGPFLPLAGIQTESTKTCENLKKSLKLAKDDILAFRKIPLPATYHFTLSL